MTLADQEQGTTHIEDAVVAKIAGLATREVSGVHALGGQSRGAAIQASQGVVVEVGQSETAVDISIVAEYGVAIHELATVIRRNVKSAIESMTGLSVTEVNITVHDIYLGPEDEGSDELPPRVK